eukprot:6194024-Pleurochrysis_carterae.AAC.3
MPVLAVVVAALPSTGTSPPLSSRTALGNQLSAAMQEDALQRAIDSSAVLEFLRNQILFYWQGNPVSLSVPTAVVTPCASAYAQSRGASATGQT